MNSSNVVLPSGCPSASIIRTVAAGVPATAKIPQSANKEQLIKPYEFNLLLRRTAHHMQAWGHSGAIYFPGASPSAAAAQASPDQLAT